MRYATMRLLLLASLISAILPILHGCGDGELSTVSGDVKLSEKPLADGIVTFRPAGETKGPEFSGTISHGAYRVADPVIPGTYAVEVHSWQKTGRTVKSPFGNDTDEIVDIIPKQYRGPDTTLSANLVVGDNYIDLNLASQP